VIGRELRELLGLAAPVVVVQVGLMAMGVVDTIMVGHVSSDALAAVALGNLYFFLLCIFGMGVLMALDPVVAQAVGAVDATGIARGLQRGLVLAALLTVPTTLILLGADRVLAALGQPESIIPIASGFVGASLPGVLPFYVFVVLRQTMQAMGLLRPIVGTILAANVLNLALNWLLVFGHGGLPALGAVGSGWASTITRWVMAAGLWALAWPALKPYLSPWRPESLAPAPLLRMFRLGMPIGGQMLLEIGVFSVIALFMGRLGPIPLAGHQVAINLASLTFMVPLGVSAAAAVLVGRAIGRGNPVEVRHAALLSLACGAGFMVLSALVLLALPRAIASLYTNDPAVIAMAAILIPLAGIFQVFDGIQVVSAGVLRGMGDTKAPLIVNLLGFWLIGLPVSLFLGFRLRGGPAGLWWGLVVGLVAVALFLLFRVRAQVRHAQRPIEIDRKVPENPEPQVEVAIPCE
jgi:MATE family multidrug resistance protein